MDPHVTVITPVYNGGRYLADCIESVLAQTHQNWQYLILNNASTDDTGAVARRYAERDPRIRVFDNPTCLPMFKNWNRSMSLLPPDSPYCKVLHADDRLYPTCLKRMVELAEANPAVGIVSSYHMDGDQISGRGVSPSTTVMSGRDICRATLLSELSVFGSPSSILLRSTVVRERPEFYDEGYFHADKAVCLAILQKWDFGFVHEVLTFTRLHEESQTVTFADRFETRILEHVMMLREFGPAFFENEEFNELLKTAETSYYRYLARQILRRRPREFFAYHRKRLLEKKMPLSTGKLLRAALAEIVDHAAHPSRLVTRVKTHAPAIFGVKNAESR